MSVVVWLLCAIVLTAFLDNRPDPPATKPSLAAAVSTSHLPASFSHPDWDGNYSISASVQLSRWIDLNEVLTVEYRLAQGAIFKRASDSSPPSAV